MLEVERADNSITQAAGIFSNCGPGVNTYELRYNCKGPACSSINGFQKVTCNTDGGGMSCSNDVKCPPGISSYMSNFTFTQNDGDPWNPSSMNERDSRVHQQQQVMLPSCAKFSLTSDGTKEGTRVDEGGRADEKECPKVRETPSPTAGAGLARKTSSTARPQASASGKPELAQSNSGFQRKAPKSMYFITFLFALMLLLPGTSASATNERRDELRRKAELRIRDVSDKVKTFAEEFGSELAERANAQGQNGEVFAHNLVADVVSSVCDSYFSGRDPGVFTPVVVEDCVKSIYGGEKLPQAAGQFFAVFGASLLCDYAVSEAYPVAAEFFPDGCEGLQEIARKISPRPTVGPSPAPASPVPATNQASNAPQSVAPQSNAPQSVIPQSNVPQSVAPPSNAPPSNAPPSIAPPSNVPASAPAETVSVNRASPAVPIPSDSPAPQSPPPTPEPSVVVPTPSPINPASPPAVSESAPGVSPSAPVVPSDPLRTPLPSEREPSPSLLPRPSESRPEPGTPSPVIPSATPSREEPSFTPTIITPSLPSTPLERPSTPVSPVESPRTSTPPGESPPSSIQRPSPPSEISTPGPSSPGPSSPGPSSPGPSSPSPSSPGPSSPGPSSPSPSSPPTRTSTPSISIRPPVSNSTTPVIPTPTCDPNSGLRDYCPGIGCVSFDNDRQHCGGCNNQCDNCDNAECYCEEGREVDESGSCRNITSTCAGQDINFDFDNQHCGGCNKTCAYECYEGVCLCPGPVRELPSIENGFCNTTSRPEPTCPEGVDLMTNNTHCGACNQTCIHECYKGQCLCPVTHLPLGEENNCTMTIETCPKDWFPFEDYCCIKDPDRWDWDDGEGFDIWLAKYCLCGNGRRPNDARGCNGVSCPEGYNHDLQYDVCCEPGTSWDPQLSNCTAITDPRCPKGLEFWDNYDLCCPPGTQDEAQLSKRWPSACVCPSGITPGASGNCTEIPTECPNGQFMDEEFHKCCPEGMVWSNQSQNCTGAPPICPAGEFMDEVYHKCCPNGTTWDNEYQNCTGTPPSCPEGMVWSSQSQNCTGAPPVCPDGEFMDEVYHKCCPNGTTWDNEYQNCTGTPPSCPEGMVWSEQSQNCTGAPPICPEGEFMDEVYHKCCPNGTTWDNEYQNCTSTPPSCPEGEFMDTKYQKCCPYETVWIPGANNCSVINTPPTNEGTCPDTHLLYEDLGYCCPKANKRALSIDYYLEECTCLDGRKIDPETGCDGTSTGRCPAGEHMDETYKRCCPIGQTRTWGSQSCECPSGSAWNVTRNECVCPNGYEPIEGVCYDDTARVASSSMVDTSAPPVITPSTPVGSPLPPTPSTPPPADAPSPSSIVLPTPPVPPTPTVPVVTPTPTPLSCPSSAPDQCAGACVDTQTDLNNCGSCGVICTGSCIDGGCLVVVGAPGVVVESSTLGVAMPTGAAAKFIWKGIDGVWPV